MGVRLLILLALLVGVLYCLHLLVKDYQALTAPRLLRMLFKRDTNSMNESISDWSPHVRWRMILHHDPIQCARYLYCELGATSNKHTELQHGFVYMLTLNPKEVDRTSRDVFIQAYNYGVKHQNPGHCRNEYPYCPFDYSLLFQLIDYLLHQKD
ncbi:uncharacterized protein LOC135072898 [Ostrinia nubilalis]|uniref:uncharacterized protein LOC135072898 n=1 Tax=Ostrinia nubilalis TaxID=29057 RepID=UPI00308247C5